MTRLFKRAALLTACAAFAAVMAGCGEEKAAPAALAASTAPAAAAEAKAEPAADVPRGQARIHRPADTVYTVPEGVSVLMYHMIGDEENNDAVMTEANLRWQMEYLRDEGYHPITMQELADYVIDGAPLPTKPVCLTFDDGYKDNYTIVYPMMKEFGFPWTVFVITGHMGQPGRMTWEELSEMADSQAVTISSHTMSHPWLTELTAEDIRREIMGAQRDLKTHLGIDNPWLAFPYGDRNEIVDEAARAAGIRLAVITNAGRVHGGDRPYEIRRVWIGNQVDEAHYAERLTRDDYTIL